MKGFSMLMCAPDERRVVRALLGGLGRRESDLFLFLCQLVIVVVFYSFTDLFYFAHPEDTEIPEMTVELNLLDKLKARVTIARKIEMTQHKIKKQNHDRNWMKETAEAMEIELDSDYARCVPFPFLPSKLFSSLLQYSVAFRCFLYEIRI